MLRRNNDEDSGGAVEVRLPPSKDELRDRRLTIAIVTLAAVVLGVAILLRYTVLKERFEPRPFVPAPVASPSAGATPDPSATPGDTLTPSTVLTPQKSP